VTGVQTCALPISLREEGEISDATETRLKGILEAFVKAFA